MADETAPQGSIWIRTTPTVDGSSFVVTIEIDEDRAMTLNPGKALRYARTLMTAVAYAEYDAAVYAQMGDKVGAAEAYALVSDLQADRRPFDPSGTEPLRFLPALTKPDRRPVVLIKVDGAAVGAWTIPDAKEHALAVLQAVAVADLDAAYLRTLRGVVGLDEATSRNVVEDLGKHREAS